MRSVFTLGESLIDFVSSTPGRLETTPAFTKAAGGAPANVAACVGRLGGRAVFIGKHGADPFGEFISQTLEKCGVDIQYFRSTAQAKTGLAFVALDENGDRSFMFYRDPAADMLLTVDDVPIEAIGDSGILHVGSVSLAAEPARSATLYAAEKAKQGEAFVSYDPNWRPNLWTDEAHGNASIQLLFPYCDSIKVNRDELQLLAKTNDLETGAAFFHNHGIRIVFITLDADGCFYSAADQAGRVVTAQHIRGVPVEVQDTTGAGDAFIGSLLYCAAKSQTAFEEPYVALDEWVRFAVHTSALVTTKRGAIPSMPTLQEVQDFMARTR